ncbi:hypothetical protein [Nonlabens sp.]|uniref:hypothetical protein n=1 Tax=Nonlabens sp. TaxID=1888209 RepID=UPI003262DEC3
MKNIKITIYLIAITFLFSCSSNQSTSKDSEVNTKLNYQYRKSRTENFKTLTKNELVELRKKIEEGLHTKISASKTIFIDFNQKASNCIDAAFTLDENKDLIDRHLDKILRYSKENNVESYFVYTSDSHNRTIYKSSNYYILDSGIFYNEIFTKHENCVAFLILKPNGDFYEYYGEDYFSEVIKIINQ